MGEVIELPGEGEGAPRRRSGAEHVATEVITTVVVLILAANVLAPAVWLVVRLYGWLL